MTSKRVSGKENDGEKIIAQKEGIDHEDMGCGQRCFFTYGQMCKRTGELFGCCVNTYRNEMEKEKRWEETVTVKEKVLKQRDHLVKLEKEQKQLMDTMIAFQLDSTMQMEETGESIRKELKKAFRMEVDISTKELMNKHERLAKEQNGMNASIASHAETLNDLDLNTNKIKKELNETFIQLQQLDDQLGQHEKSADIKIEEMSERINKEDDWIKMELETLKEENRTTHELLMKEQLINEEQNTDLEQIKGELNDQKGDDEDLTLLERLKKRADNLVVGSSEETEYSVDEEGVQKTDENGEPKKRPKKKRGVTEKMKRLLARDELSEGDLPDVPDEDPEDRHPHYEHMIHTPDEEETKSEYDLRLERNEEICSEKAAEEKMAKRKMKKRAKRKKLAEQEKDMKNRSTKIAAAGGGGAALPAHVTQG